MNPTVIIIIIKPFIFDRNLFLLSYLTQTYNHTIYQILAIMYTHTHTYTFKQNKRPLQLQCSTQQSNHMVYAIKMTD